jgi:hypothetical protein
MAAKTLRQQTIGFGGDQFVGGNESPEVGTIDLKKFAGAATEKLDQGTGRDAIGHGLGKLKQQSLKGVFAVVVKRKLGRREVSSLHSRQQCQLQVIEYNGKIAHNLNLSQDYWEWECLTVNLERKS